MTPAEGSQAGAPPRREPLDAGAWAALALAILLVAAGVALALARAAQPDDGYRVDPFAAGQRDGLPIDEGSSIMSIGGVGAEEMVARAIALRPAPPPEWHTGGTPHYEFAWEYGRYAGRVMLTPSSGARLENVWDLALLAYLPVATLVFARRPRLPAARVLLLFAAAQLASAIARSAAGGWGGLRVADLLGPGLFWPTLLLAGGLLPWPLLTHFALVFPRQSQIYLRRRALALAALYGLPVALLVGGAAACTLSGRALDFLWLAALVGGLGIIASAAALALSLAGGYRRAAGAAERAQVLWGGLGFALFAAWIFAIAAGLALLWLGVPAGSALDTLWGAGGALILAQPLFIGIAVLRHRLFDIDVALSRALVYGALTACLAAAYGAALGGLGLLLHGGGWPAAVAAAALAGALAHPLHERLQRLAGRALYGDRDEPALALERLSDRLGAAIAPDSVIPTIVGAVAEATRAPYVAVTAPEESGGAVLAERGAPGGRPAVRFPIEHHGERLGQLAVAPRAGESGYGPADERLLRHLAAQAGAAVHAARLTADLRRSRERVVTAREEERRRLQRDIHDGLGPALAGMTLKVDAALNLLDADRPRAEALLRELRGQVSGATSDIRRLVYALRPPALAQLGLAGALEDLADQVAPPPAVELRLPPELPPLSAAAELACYRIVQEALANAARHSGAQRCSVEVAVDAEAVRVTVADDGVGLPEGRRDGVGLRAMRERAEELGGSCAVAARPGGGTEVRASIPR